MSAINRGNKRRDGDYYPTPDELALRIVERVAAGRWGVLPCVVLEPSAGSGAFVRAIKSSIPMAAITAIEPSERADHVMDIADVHRCSLESYAEQHGKGFDLFDLIIGNPPYSLAEEHVRLCLNMLAPGGSLVFLLRLAFLESQKRKALFSEFPPARVITLSERPSFCWSWGCKACKSHWTSEIGQKPFDLCPECGHADLTKSSTDSTAYAVFEWVDGQEGPTVLEWM